MRARADLPELPRGFSGKPWPQHPQEIGRFAEILAEAGCRSYLEVGCRYGDTFQFIGMHMPKGSRLVALDMPGADGKHGGSGNYLHLAANSLRANGREVDIVLGNSHDADTLRRVTALGPFDAVFIDGDHSPAGTYQDWLDYGCMGRVVGFHDLVGDEDRYRQGVNRLFHQLAQTHRHEAIVRDSPRKMGIGVIWRDPV